MKYFSSSESFHFDVTNDLLTFFQPALSRRLNDSAVYCCVREELCEQVMRRAPETLQGDISVCLFKNGNEVKLRTLYRNLTTRLYCRYYTVVNAATAVQQIHLQISTTATAKTLSW